MNEKTKDPFNPDVDIWKECGETTSSEDRTDNIVDMIESPLEKDNHTFLENRKKEAWKKKLRQMGWWT